MRFALLIYSTESNAAQWTEEQVQQNMGRWFGFTEELRNSGKMLAGEALMPVNTAHTVRIPGSGETTVMDGPFAETKEQFGGFYLVEADSWEEASEWAKKMPVGGNGGGSVEIRPLMEFDQG